MGINDATLQCWYNICLVHSNRTKRAPGCVSMQTRTTTGQLHLVGLAFTSHIHKHNIGCLRG